MQITSYSDQDLKVIQALNNLVKGCSEFISVVNSVNHALYELGPKTLTMETDNTFLSSFLGEATETLISQLKEIQKDAEKVSIFLAQVASSLPKSNITTQTVENFGLDILLNSVRRVIPSIPAWETDIRGYLKKIEKEAQAALIELAPIQRNCWASLHSINEAIDQLNIPRSGVYRRLPEQL